jgi:DHA1 family multidrug resistance protein-like MFS transporter
MGMKSKLFEKIRTLPQWQKNIYVLWLGTFLTGISFSEITPFLSFYVDELGKFSKTQLNFYSGIVFAVTFLVSAVVSPLWGRLADKKGRKLMLLRASLGMAIVFSLMGLTQNVYQLIGLRALQGVFSGYISNANALVATETPKEHSGRALGILVTGSTAGNLIGPLFGGALANWLDYRDIFFFTGGLLFAAFILSVFFVHDTFIPAEANGDGENIMSFKELYKSITYPRLLLGLLVTTLIIQMANTSINPILSLYVRELAHGNHNITFTAGVVASIPGIATIIAAPRFGRLGDKVGTDRMLMFGFLWATLMLIGTSFIHTIPLLILFRFGIGISDATMLPAVNTLLAKNTPIEATGRIFSYNQSFMALGAVVGPMIGTTISSAFGYGNVFLATAALVFLNLILFTKNSKVLRSERNNA